MVKIQNFNNQFRVTIPKDIVKLMGWDENTELVFLVNESLENIIVKEIKNAKRKK